MQFHRGEFEAPRGRWATEQKMENRECREAFGKMFDQIPKSAGVFPDWPGGYSRTAGFLLPGFPSPQGQPPLPIDRW
ncbi:MAG TPA: hypothetical protein DDY91_21755 [Planctomycetaceae bacterium]|nr:hypothetical protein [Planctomycetaceae bacterium]